MGRATVSLTATGLIVWGLLAAGAAGAQEVSRAEFSKLEAEVMRLRVKCLNLERKIQTLQEQLKKALEKQAERTPRVPPGLAPPPWGPPPDTGDPRKMLPGGPGGTSERVSLVIVNKTPWTVNVSIQRGVTFKRSLRPLGEARLTVPQGAVSGSFMFSTGTGGGGKAFHFNVTRAERWILGFQQSAAMGAQLEIVREPLTKTPASEKGPRPPRERTPRRRR